MAEELRTKKISELPIADTLGDNDVLVGVQEGVTKRFAAVSLDRKAVQVVPDILTVASLKRNGSSKVALAEGFYEPGDGGGGLLVLVDDGSMSLSDVIADDGGRWRRQFSGSVDVRRFGVAGGQTGLVNASALRLAADFAAEAGRSLYADGEFEYDATEGPVNLRTSFDFGSARIVCRNVSEDTYGGGLVILSLEGSSMIEVPVALADLVKGTNYVGSLADQVGFLKLTSSRVTTVRQIGSTRTDVLQGEANEVTNGYLSSPLLFGYSSASDVKAFVRPHDVAIVGVLPYFDLTGAWINTPVRVRRNNVSLSKFDSNNKKGSYLNIDVQDQANFKLSDVFAPTMGDPSTVSGSTAAYVCTMTFQYHSLFENVHNKYGWDCIDGNYFRRHTVKDSTVVSFGGHSMSADQELLDSTVFNASSVMGYGYLRAKRVRHLVDRLYSNSYIGIFLSLRTDYGPHYEGTVEIDGLTAICQPNITRYIVFRDELPAYDHGAITCLSPERVSIKNVNIQYLSSLTSDPTSAVFVLYLYLLNRNGGTNAYLPKKRLPSEIEVEGVRLTPGPFNTSSPSVSQVRITDQSTALKTDWTVGNFVNGKIRISAKDCPTLVDKTRNFTDVRYYGLNTFDVQLSEVKQEIRIFNSDFLGVTLRTELGVDCEVSNSKQSGLLQKGTGVVPFPSSRTLPSTSFFKFFGCEIFGLTGPVNDATYGPDAHMCVLAGCRVRFPARMYEQPTTTAHALGFPGGLCVDAAAGSFVDAAEPGGLETYNPVITRVTNGYANTTIFYKP